MTLSKIKSVQKILKYYPQFFSKVLQEIVGFNALNRQKLHWQLETNEHYSMSARNERRTILLLLVLLLPGTKGNRILLLYVHAIKIILFYNNIEKENIFTIFF